MQTYKFKDSDLLFLKFLLETPGHAMTEKQILKFYSDCDINDNSVKKKMWRYQDSELIDKKTRPIVGGKIFSGNRNTINALDYHLERMKKLCRRKNYDCNFFRPKMKYKNYDVRMRNYFHDEELNDIALRLIKDYDFTKQKSELMLEDELNQNADWYFENDFVKFAVEYERTLKSKKERYKNIFHQYVDDLKDENIDYVLYIARDEVIQKNLLKRMKELIDVHNQDKFIITNYDKFLTRENFKVCSAKSIIEKKDDEVQIEKTHLIKKDELDFIIE